ncbi:hypothetical protein [Sorangium sp. So ce1000]|uniref:hypothetical protein n=1 Tax=Sorangium sp. So ce1000 TaxID=3133325 RepID=UPI003F6485FE
MLPADTNHDKLLMRFKVPGTSFKTLYFPTVQTCRSAAGVATTVEWNDTRRTPPDAGPDAAPPASPLERPMDLLRPLGTRLPDDLTPPVRRGSSPPPGTAPGWAGRKRAAGSRGDSRGRPAAANER